MKKFVFFGFLSVLLCISLNLNAENKTILLNITIPDESFFKNIKGSADPIFNLSEKQLLVTGWINPPDLTIKDISKALLYSPEGSEIAIFVDKSSIYSEFDDSEINSMFISFVISKDQADKGQFRFEWGDKVSAVNNVFIDKIYIYENNRTAYRRFNWEQLPCTEGSDAYTATLEVIVDDNADTYYLWYLLPMAMIFLLLIVRRLYKG